MKHLIALVAIALLCGCATRSPHSTGYPVLISRDQLDQHVGQVVTLLGEVTNSKIPTILGVDVQSNNPDLRGHVAVATGLLQRWVITEESLNHEIANRGMIANRGPGTFYRLKAMDSNYDAAVRPIHSN